MHRGKDFSLCASPHPQPPLPSKTGEGDGIDSLLPATGIVGTERQTATRRLGFTKTKLDPVRVLIAERASGARMCRYSRGACTMMPLPLNLRLPLHLQAR